MYQIMKNFLTGADVCIRRIADGALIPPDLANTDYQAYLAWVAEGGVPEPADEVTGG